LKLSAIAAARSIASASVALILMILQKRMSSILPLNLGECVSPL
jgi:hypothetical protein